MEWRPLTLSHQAVKFGGFKDCSSGDMLLICHVILQDHVIKRSCNFSVRIPELKSLRNFQIMHFHYSKYYPNVTGQKMKFSTRDLFSKCGQIRSFLRISSDLLKKSVIESLIFCAVHTKIFKSVSITIASG